MDERSDNLRIDDVDRERLVVRVKDFVRVVIKVRHFVSRAKKNLLTAESKCSYSRGLDGGVLAKSASVSPAMGAQSEFDLSCRELAHVKKELLADATEVILRELGRTTLRSLSRSERKEQSKGEKVVVVKQKEVDMREKKDTVKQKNAEMREENVGMEKMTPVAREKINNSLAAPESPVCHCVEIKSSFYTPLQEPDMSEHKQNLPMTPLIPIHDGGVVELERPPTPKKDRRRKRAALKAAEVARKPTPKMLKKRAAEKVPEKPVTVPIIDTVEANEAPMYSLGDRKGNIS